jgi:hypothetical protein
MPFDYEKFSAECSVMSEDALQKEWQNYTRQIAGSSTTTAISICAAPITLGVSFIGLGIACPRIHNTRKKREIIQTHLEALSSTHHTQKHDVFRPMASSSTLGTATFRSAAPGAKLVVLVRAEHAIAAIEECATMVKAASHSTLDGVGAATDKVYSKTMRVRQVKRRCDGGLG